MCAGDRSNFSTPGLCGFAARYLRTMPDDDRDNILPFVTRPTAVPDDEKPYFCFSATLRIFGHGLDLDAITRDLGIEPTHIHREGERRNPNAKPWPHDMWMLESPLDETRPLGEHLDWLYERLQVHVAYLKALKSDAMVDIFCGYRSNSDTAGFEVAYPSLRLFAELEVPFGVSVIVVGDD